MCAEARETILVIFIIIHLSLALSFDAIPYAIRYAWSVVAKNYAYEILFRC